MKHWFKLSKKSFRRHSCAGQRPQPTAALREQAQAIILIALAFVVLLAFVGLVTDVGTIYVTWTRLKRAIDSASVAAANNMKSTRENIPYEERLENMTESAREMLDLNGVTDVEVLAIETCQGYIDTAVPLPPADNILRTMCQTDAGVRKLAWIEAREDVPVYFLSILGIKSFPLVLSSVGEAAVLDLVLVFDTSESMGLETIEGGELVDEQNFNPAACNSSNTCYPLREAKDAAASLIRRLYEGYDRIAIVTFDYDARQVFPIPAGTITHPSNDIEAAVSAVYSSILLNDDAPLELFAWNTTRPCWNCWHGGFNPAYPEDRDGDAEDGDGDLDSCVVFDEPIDNLYRIDEATYDFDDPPGDPMTIDPCDLPDRRDVYDWSNDPNEFGDRIFGDDIDHGIGDSLPRRNMSTVSTCIGCGIRVARDILAEFGRPGGVWAIVFLTDGAANMSDTPRSWPYDGERGIPATFPNGFCTKNFWTDWCQDLDRDGVERYCIDVDSDTCPPDTTYASMWEIDGQIATNYSVVDYARDMVDDAALVYPEDHPTPNLNEPQGEDIVMFSISFGDMPDTIDLLRQGLPLMHYMADVGEDGVRGGPCADGAGSLDYDDQCGNYYYAADGRALERVFEAIIARIFTKISH